MEETPSPEPQKAVLRFVFFKRFNHPLLKIAALLIVIFGLLIILSPHSFFDSYFGAKKEEPLSVPELVEVPSLVVLGMTPTGKVGDVEKIVFSFSDPVDPHTLSHVVAFSPQITGNFEQGANEREVVFRPDTKLPRGVHYSVSIQPGLISKNHKELLDDFHDGFTLEKFSSLVRFVTNNFEGRVLSFPANNPIKLQVEAPETGSHVALADMTVNLYRSNQANLLNYLLYKEEKVEYNSYSTKQENYLTEGISHTKAEFLEKKAVNEQKRELSFQLKPGIYYGEAVTKDDEKIGSVFLVVSTKAVALRQDDQKITLSAFDLSSGQRVSERANVGFFTLENTPQLLKSQSFAEIESSVAMPFSSRVDAVVGSFESGEPIFIPLKLPLSLADIQVTADLNNRHQVFIYTERPIYKPGDTVFFRGVVRKDSDALYAVPPSGQQVFVRLGYGDTPKVEITTATNASGVFSGNFTIPEDLKGVQYLYASTKNEKEQYWSNSDSTYFDVVKYTKPTFTLQVDVGKSEYIRSDKLQFTVSGTYLNGKPMVGQVVDYSFFTKNFYETEKAVYNSNFNIQSWGGMCGGGFSAFEEYYGEELPSKGNIKLDKDGKAVVTLNLQNKEFYSQTITLVAKKKDTAGNEIVSAANAIVHASDFNMFFMPSGTYYKKGGTVVAPFYTETLTGEKIANKTFTYTLTDRVYENEYRKYKETSYLSGTVTTDSNGKGIVTFALPKDKNNVSLYLGVEATDAKGNLVRVEKSLQIQDKLADDYDYWGRRSIQQTYLNIVSSQNSFKVGETITLSVRSPQELDALLSLERGRIYEPRLVHLNKGDNTVTIRVGTDLSPSITVVFTFFADGTYHTEGLALNVPAMHKLMQVGLTSDKKVYRPNETAQVKVTTKDANGNLLPAQMSLGIVDKAIYALRKNATPPIHSSFYYFRERNTNSSSSLTWVGQYRYGGRGGGGGGGGDLLGSTVDTLYWDPNLITDYTGETIVQVPLGSTQTTWKAQVLASSEKTDLGQAETEFIVTTQDVLSAKDRSKKKK